jgi:CRP/FNR family cyclic AMP-dependent transcriptional regulator
MRARARPLSEVLYEAAWMKDLPNAARQLVLSDAHDRWFAKGESVATTGEPAHAWIGVAEGLLKVSSVQASGKVVMFTGIPEGSWMGEGSLVRRGLFKFDVTAMRPSRVIFLPGATFRRLLDESIEFNHIIIAHLNERLSQYIAMKESERSTDPVTRLARAIGMLYNPVLYPNMSAVLTLSQSELGELVGLSRQSVSVAHKALVEKGFIGSKYGGLVVRDLNALVSY